MTVVTRSRVPGILREHQADLIAEWTAELAADRSQRHDLIRPEEVREQASEFVRLLAQALERGDPRDLSTSEWAALRQHLESITRTRVQQGFTPSSVARFVLCFKRPLFATLRAELSASEVIDEIWNATRLLDDLGLWTTEVYQRSRDEIISRQQHEMLELSTPVVKLWDGILGLPMIGTLDSARTQVVMETLLQRIVATGSQMAIIDITGVPTVDTLVAQHLLKTVAAARLMGTEVIISGVRPQIAQTIVHLGVDLGQVVTKASLADAFALALQRSGLMVVTREPKARA
jgi:rsbT co-antagonist protein RsbR